MARKDPFDDDDNETTQPTPEPAEEKGEKLSVEPDPNDEDSEQSTDTEEQKAARRERRKERGTLRAAAEDERKRREDAERVANEAVARATAAETTARLWAEQSRQSQPQVDPWAQAIENEVTPRRQALMAEHRQLVESQKYTPEEQRRLAAEWNKLDIRQQEIITHKQLYYRDLQAQQTAPQMEERQRLIALNEQIKVRYPDIIANEDAARWMNYRFMQMVQAERKPNTFETGDLAAAETRRAFKMGTRPAPDAATKARYSGVGGGANGHTNGDGKIEMIPRFRKLAESLYPDMPPAKAHKKWAEGPGKKILASEE